MNRITLSIEGMACGMCEAHMNDLIRKTFPDAKKVSSSRKKGETVFLTDSDIDEEVLKKAVAETGYELKGVKSELYKKKGLFG